LEVPVEEEGIEGAGRGYAFAEVEERDWLRRREEWDCEGPRRGEEIDAGVP